MSQHGVLLHGEQNGGALAIAESTMPAGAVGPPLHSHAFDEAFYVPALMIKAGRCRRR